LLGQIATILKNKETRINILLAYDFFNHTGSLAKLCGLENTEHHVLPVDISWGLFSSKYDPSNKKRKNGEVLVRIKRVEISAT
jgi:hypothetical protein